MGSSHAPILPRVAKLMSMFIPASGLRVREIDPTGDLSHLELDTVAGVMPFCADLPTVVLMYGVLGTQVIPEMINRQRTFHLDQGAASLDDMERDALVCDCDATAIRVSRETGAATMLHQFRERPPLAIRYDKPRTMIARYFAAAKLYLD